MAQAVIHRATIEAPVLDLLTRERQKALSAREWKFRLIGYGYGIKDVGGRQMLTKLPQNTMLGILPTHLN